MAEEDTSELASLLYYGSRLLLITKAKRILDEPLKYPLG